MCIRENIYFIMIFPPILNLYYATQGDICVFFFKIKDADLFSTVFFDHIYQG